MNVNRISILLGLLALFGTTVAMAQPRAIVENDSAPVGTSTVTITVQYEDGANNGTAAQFDVTYDQTVMTPNIASTCPNASWGCSLIAPNIIRFASSFFPGGDLPDFSGDVVFDTSATPVGFYALPVSNEVYTNAGGQVSPSGTQDGSITIQGPDAQFSPAPGTTLIDTSVQQGGTDPTDSVDVSNVGPSGTELDVSCVEFPDTAAFSITGGTINNLTPAGSPATVTVTCDAGQSPDTYSGTMRCTHNGDGTTDTSPADFPLSCTVTPGPAPAYSSTPTAGSTLDFGTVAKGDTDPEQGVSISNSGDTGTTLTGTCSITNPTGNPFYFVGAVNTFSVGNPDSPDVITVGCDSDVVGTHSGTLSCAHNGSNPPDPATYPLTCTVPPDPSISTTLSPDPLDLGPVPQNNTDPTGTLTIDNDGDPNSTLDGTCSLTDGTGPISIQSGGGVYSVPEAGPNQVVTVACDTANPPGTYNDTLSCTHDDPNVTSPVTFPVSCEISQPDAAIYGSTPTSGSTINITQGLDVVVGDPDPTAGLEIRNDAPAGDADMNVTCQLNQVTGTAISVDPAVNNVVLSPGDSQNVTFTCDTTTANPEGTPFEATYGCDWFSVTVPGAQTVEDPQSFQESYTINCEVRDPESNVDPETPSGTTVTEPVEPGGSAQFPFTFDEVNDENVDGELDCSLDPGSDAFTILSPDFTSGPVPVPAGQSVTVTVEGTDPGGVDSAEGTLRCTYYDSANPEGTEVFYNLVLLIGGNASFAVDKVFTDGNPGEVLVTISCNTGLPLEQSKLISQGDGVKFIVGNFDTGELDCSVTEEAVNGYSADYDASGSASSYVDDDVENPGCHYADVTGGDDNVCVITNSPDPVDVVITKDWIIEGSNLPQGISTRYNLTLYCDAQIVEGSPVGGEPFTEDPAGVLLPPCGLLVGGAEDPEAEIALNWCKTFGGDGSDEFTAGVIPRYPSSNCYVVENVYDDAVEVDNGCTGLTISAGNGASCTITNTVFFEGIPTLSQYGLAVLALLMLGVGLVGFRRYS